MIKKWFQRRRFSATFRTVQVEYLNEQFTLREMSTSERLAFSEFVEDQNHNQMMIAAWTLSQVCIDFAGMSIDKIVTEVSPSALAFLLEEALNVSAMTPQALEEAEKKSENTQSMSSSST